MAAAEFGKGALSVVTPTKDDFIFGLCLVLGGPAGGVAYQTYKTYLSAIDTYQGVQSAGGVHNYVSEGISDTLEYVSKNPYRFAGQVTTSLAISYGAGKLAAGAGVKGAKAGNKWKVSIDKYQHGGGGINFLKNSQRKFAIDVHKFNHKGKLKTRLHYHRGKTKSQIKKHRPYQGGW